MEVYTTNPVPIQRLIENLTSELLTTISSKTLSFIEMESNFKSSTKELAYLRHTNSLLKIENNKVPSLIERIMQLEMYLDNEIHKIGVMKCDLSQNDVDKCRIVESHYIESEKQLRKEIIDLKTSSSEREKKFRRIINACAGIQDENLDEMLDSLLVAVEGDDSKVNISHLAVFMNRVEETMQKQ